MQGSYILIKYRESFLHVYTFFIRFEEYNIQLIIATFCGHSIYVNGEMWEIEKWNFSLLLLLYDFRKGNNDTWHKDRLRREISLKFSTVLIIGWRTEGQANFIHTLSNEKIKYNWQRHDTRNYTLKLRYLKKIGSNVTSTEQRNPDNQNSSNKCNGYTQI